MLFLPRYWASSRTHWPSPSQGRLLTVPSLSGTSHRCHMHYTPVHVWGLSCIAMGASRCPPPKYWPLVAKPHVLGIVEFGKMNVVLYVNSGVFSIAQERLPENQTRTTVSSLFMAPLHGPLHSPSPQVSAKATPLICSYRSGLRTRVWT